MHALVSAYNKTSTYATDKDVSALKEFFILLMNEKKDDDGTLTKSINEIYNAIRKNINPQAKGFEYQLYTIGPHFNHNH
jgi:hypothetical protein